MNQLALVAYPDLLGLKGRFKLDENKGTGPRFDRVFLYCLTVFDRVFDSFTRGLHIKLKVYPGFDRVFLPFNPQCTRRCTVASPSWTLTGLSNSASTRASW